MAGQGAWISFLLSGMLALITGMSYAELSSRIPHSAGAAAYASRAFAAPLVPFLVGVLVLASGITSAATASLAFQSLAGTRGLPLPRGGIPCRDLPAGRARDRDRYRALFRLPYLSVKGLNGSIGIALFGRHLLPISRAPSFFLARLQHTNLRSLQHHRDRTLPEHGAARPLSIPRVRIDRPDRIF